MAGGRLQAGSGSVFLRFWAGQSVSAVGTEVTMLALPTAAIVLLHAGPFEIGLLGAIQYVATPVLGPLAGVMADRWDRRRILIACDLTRMLAVASIPAAYLAHWLTMAHVYGVALVTGVATAFFVAAYQAYLPALVDRADLVTANSRLQTSQSAARVLGPALGGGLIQVFQAATAMAADALSYVGSVLALLSIRGRTPGPGPDRVTRPGLLAEMAEGVRHVLRAPTVRLLCASGATSNLGGALSQAVLLVYAYDNLHLSPGTMGAVLAIASVAAIGGALSTAALTRRLGLRSTLAWSALLSGAPLLAVPLASLGAAAAVVAVPLFVSSFFFPIYNVNQVSLRQAVTPDEIQGRMNATVRTFIWSTIPVGRLAGGVIGAWTRVELAIVAGAAVASLAALWILFMRTESGEVAARPS